MPSCTKRDHAKKYLRFRGEERGGRGGGWSEKCIFFMSGGDQCYFCLEERVLIDLGQQTRFNLKRDIASLSVGKKKETIGVV